MNKQTRRLPSAVCGKEKGGGGIPTKAIPLCTRRVPLYIPAMYIPLCNTRVESPNRPTRWWVASPAPSPFSDFFSTCTYIHLNAHSVHIPHPTEIRTQGFNSHPTQIPHHVHGHPTRPGRGNQPSCDFERQAKIPIAGECAAVFP